MSKVDLEVTNILLEGSI